jgi:hypothetical protein
MLTHNIVCGHIYRHLGGHVSETRVKLVVGNGLPNDALEIDPFEVKVLEVVAWRKRALDGPVVN